MRCAPPLFPPKKKQHQSKIQSTSPHPRIPGKKWGWFLFGLPSWRHLFLNWFLLLQAMLRKSSEYLLIWSTILWYFSWHLSCEICSLHHTSETNQPFKKHREHYETNRPHHTTTTNYTFPPVVLTISRSEAEVNLLVPLAGWGIVGHLKHPCFFW